MAGTPQGAKKSAAKILAKNPNHYVENGRIGGKQSRGGGFAHPNSDPREAGRRGGLKSKRRKHVQPIE